MKAEIKGYHSPEIDDLNNFYPDNIEKFSFLLQLFIGIKNNEGEESFNIQVCTPKWLEEYYKNDGLVFGYHKIIVFDYDFNLIKKRLEKFVNTIEGENWDEISNKLRLIGHWEFEDYKEYDK